MKKGFYGWQSLISWPDKMKPTLFTRCKSLREVFSCLFIWLLIMEFQRISMVEHCTEECPKRRQVESKLAVVLAQFVFFGNKNIPSPYWLEIHLIAYPWGHASSPGIGGKRKLVHYFFLFHSRLILINFHFRFVILATPIFTFMLTRQLIKFNYSKVAGGAGRTWKEDPRHSIPHPPNPYPTWRQRPPSGTCESSPARTVVGIIGWSALITWIC